MSMKDTYKFKQAIQNRKKQSSNKFLMEYSLFAICIVILLFNMSDINISFVKNINSKKEQVLSLPDNGQIQIFTDKELLAPLGIVGSSDKNCFFKFYDIKENIVFTLFIRKNSSVSLKIPLGEYIVKYATGDEWYGVDKLFGFSTDTYEFNKKLLFYREGNTLKGHTLTLNEVLNGNLSKKNISKLSF